MPEPLQAERLLLSNCAYWAMNALGVEGSQSHVIEITRICLENILKASSDFIMHNPNADSTVIYGGVYATLIPLEGWPEPEIEWM